MSMDRRISNCEYRASKEEQFYWSVFVVFCMLGTAAMFVIAWFELS